VFGDRRNVVIAGAAAVVLVVVGVVAVPRLLGGDDGPDPGPDAQAFLDAWAEGDPAGMAEHVADPPETFAEDFAALTDGLAVTSAEYELGDVERDGDEATAAFDATVQLGGLGEWSYTGELALRRVEGADGAGSGGEGGEGDGGDTWAVVWSPATVHPELGEGQRLVRTRERPARGAITGVGGAPLASDQAAVRVGIQPSRVQDLNAVKAALQEQLGVDPATVDAEMGRPGVQPDHFVPIVTVRQDRYDQVRSVIYPIPGLLFQETTTRGAASEGSAQHIVGRTGDITAELLEELGPTYAVGDQVGLTGLEAQFESELAGTPSGEVQVVDESDEVVTVLHEIAGTEPVPLETTLDPAVQTAVESALAPVTRPAAIVVVDAAGNVRGAASRPLNEDLNRALAGAYPPGSTAKVVTANALLASGTTPESPIECAPTVDAGGRSFRNFESSSLGTVPFGLAFAESCNTAMITAAAPLPPADLVASAEQFGFNAEYSVGLSTEGGSYPEPADATEQAAAAIGQGRIVASPLHMATVAGTVIDGTWEPPVLLPDHPDEDAPEPTTIDPGARETLAGLMRRVVTEGSGTAADVPGQQIFGKTGTAEFGTGDPPPTHAWFIGSNGRLAASVFIENGGVGGRDAAPVAGRLLAALPAG
jgi:cell division protein FtsI/penicillin-binding protein 2